MKSKIIIVSILIIFLFSIGAVSAIEDTNDTAVGNEDILPVNDGEEVNDDLYSINEDENEYIMAENDGAVSNDLNSNHFGYWEWSKDNYTDFADLSRRGVTDILLNYYALERYSQEYVESYIAAAKEEGVNVHIWAQIFYEGSWIRPIDRQGNVNYAYFDSKTAELEYYASIKGVAGVHYDYLRFSGSELYDNTAWQNPGGKEAITYFVKQSTEAIRKVNPDLIISAALMPEIDMLENTYGVEYTEITKYFDVVMPMVYRGNFREDAAWVYDTTKYFVDNSQGSVVWTGLQGYVDDDHSDNKLPLAELINDTNNALDAGAKGVVLFKIYCAPDIDFNNLTVDENQLNSFEYLYYLTSSTYGTLNLERDYVFNESIDNAFINGIEIYNNRLTINGNNHVIDGKNLSRIFKITGNDVTLTNIQFVNAFTDRSGAAAYIGGKNVKFINCSFTDNLAERYGGAVYIESNNVELINCSFTNNAAIMRGGAAYIYGDNVNLINCSFTNNSAITDGGASFIEGYYCQVVNSSFKDNFAETKGGASYITGRYFKLINSSFIDNAAITESGAIYTQAEYGNINNCTFINNSAKYTGAVLLKSTNGKIIGSYFENNTAEISAAAIGISERRNNIIENCVFVNNSVYNEGGAAIFVNKAIYAKIINSTFLDNYANYNGGGIFWVYGHGSIINSTFINNTATEKGGAIYHIGDNITILGSIFKDNAGVNGSAVYLDNGTNNVLSEDIIVSNSLYINNIDNSKISDSIILDKIISNNSTVLFTNDWFGNTKNNYNESLNEYANNWLYLNASADKTMVGEDTSIEFHFDQFNSLQSFDLPEITLELDGENLILDNETVLIDDSVNAEIADYGAYVYASYGNVTLKYELPIADINVFADDVIKYYGDPQRFVVSVLDSESNPISNKTVTITVNGVDYSKTTDENGSSSIGINLNSGTYNITSSVDNKTVYSTVIILSTIDADDLVKVFKNESQYYATFKDSQGNLLANASVSFNINGITYTRNTDDKGIAKMNINLNTGEYIITASNQVTGERAANNITVLSRFSENNDLIKYYKNDSQYSVKIIGDDGNPVGAGEVVTFNINGVLYNRTTNESGYATLNINLVPGFYIITAEYKTCKISNEIIVKPVLFTSDLKMSYNDGSKFTASLLDGQGKPYANQIVTFNINGVLYNRTTDILGEAKLNINLQSGEYLITSSYKDITLQTK